MKRKIRWIRLLIFALMCNMIPSRGIYAANGTEIDTMANIYIINDALPVYQTKQFGNFEIQTTFFAAKKDQIQFSANIKNISQEETPLSTFTLVFSDCKGDYLGSFGGIVGDLEPGEESRIESSAMITSYIYQVYDWTIEAKNSLFEAKQEVQTTTNWSEIDNYYYYNATSDLYEKRSDDGVSSCVNAMQTESGEPVVHVNLWNESLEVDCEYQGSLTLLDSEKQPIETLEFSYYGEEEIINYRIPMKTVEALWNAVDYRLTFEKKVEAPTEEPTMPPTIEPTEEPTIEPTMIPTVAPTEEPTMPPTIESTEEPTMLPTVAPMVTKKPKVVSPKETAAPKIKILQKSKKIIVVPQFSLTKGKKGKQKFIQLYLKKYKGKYAEIYVKKKKKYIKVSIKKKSISAYKRKYRLGYKESGMTLYFKIRTYKYKEETKIYSDFSKEKSISL